MSLSEWCEFANETVNGHELRIIVLPEGKLDLASKSVAILIPTHYSSPERIAEILESLGKEKAAAYLRGKLPQTPRIRSGDMGEILATQFIEECTVFMVPIRRLRWKDHREMPLRGDDVIGIAVSDGDGPIRFLKSEVKSRAALSTAVVKEARQALDDHGGLPSPHALSYISDRLQETGQQKLADVITSAQLQYGISEKQVTHLLFTFSGNSPNQFLKKDLEDYAGPNRQSAAGLQIKEHQQFIAAVYDAVNGNHES